MFESPRLPKKPKSGPMNLNKHEMASIYVYRVILAQKLAPPDICTTNAIKSVNMNLCKQTKIRGPLPSDKALVKFLYLVLHNISKTWPMPKHRVSAHLVELHD
ncbi:transposase [Herbaspirillum sp. CF444]|nr:transposase [Herbaspirillum sp. CF444]